MRTRILSLSGWAIVWSLALYFIYTNALRYFNPNFEIYTPDFSPFAPFIVIHVAGGIVAILLGPLQFFGSLRRSKPRLHRFIGKTYLITVLISAISAVYLAVFDNLMRKGDFGFGTGALGMAAAWFITAGMAYWAIRNRNFVQHREWMVRSYVVTSNFVIFRLMFYGLMGMESFPFKDELGGVTAWASWSVPLLITEWILQAKKIVPKKSKKAPVMEQAALV